MFYLLSNLLFFHNHNIYTYFNILLRPRSTYNIHIVFSLKETQFIFCFITYLVMHRNIL